VLASCNGNAAGVLAALQRATIVGAGCPLIAVMRAIIAAGIERLQHSKRIVR